mmetsp:Transcript_14348/g.31321  ORF Transcript_14348/g.31321 Transcript_14348/m.31321 type:complete len:754 (-) Transcript_14348:56-2317(-)|eukprot:CAMPEP_0168733658 /NCGR_PEP_ID=MMETSP0724-20121128/8406_1 /TAXON_ID=265536 /ORGANISM="Amphiprora sp., Strain CCMP467" /LENGTH=753 /DNA_ID=CAMNT_0008780727 /DNA_START=466 /DNA_END=2727 /DNA_ORIENTATION=-
MSRRRGEFEHRTSIFEGAFRAWSHLGGLDPESVESKPTADIDPLTAPLEEDPRLASQRKSGDIKEMKNPDGSARRQYPYEPLPRSGLAHPYVQAILSPWLGPDADNEAIQLGLTTLRTWWQHRRKGESGSAVAALGTEKMKGVVEGYTRHFFTLAHCLVTQDKEQPPRTLHGRMKELEKARNKRNKGKKGPNDFVNKGPMGPTGQGTDLVSDIKGDLTDSNLSPLERLHAAQRRQLASTGMIHPQMPGSTQVDVTNPPPTVPIIDMKGKCVPGKIDLPGIVEKVNHAANQLAHRGGTGGGGGGGNMVPLPAQSIGSNAGVTHQPAPVQDYGDPNKTPVVFVSGRGDIMVSMEIDGITCAHCVKIVETVLKGCSGNKSPIEGLMDAAADMKLNAVLIKIDKASNAKRIAFEAARNLSMVGYTAKVKEMSIVGAGADKKATMDLGALSTAFEVVASTDPKDVFNWALPCLCPDNGILRDDCPRHGQMNSRIFEVFDSRAKQVTDHMAGCGMKYGMECTCGPGCTCKNCPIHSKQQNNNANPDSSDQLDNNEEAQIMAAAARMQAPGRMDSSRQMQPPGPMQSSISSNATFNMGEDDPIHIEQKMEFFGVDPSMGGNGMQQQHRPNMPNDMEPLNHNQMDPMGDMGGMGGNSPRRASQRNPSIISYGGLRHMSMNSETTFGRAMSGLSALSIDWENLEDFDLEVDHSAHINNASPNAGFGGMPSDMGGMNGARRSSFRRPHNPGNSDQEAHVSFKV